MSVAEFFSFLEFCKSKEQGEMSLKKHECRLMYAASFALSTDGSLWGKSWRWTTLQALLLSTPQQS
jgi:hypothetical protein